MENPRGMCYTAPCIPALRGGEGGAAVRTSLPSWLKAGFWGAEAALYLAFLALDLSGGHPAGSWLKYAGVLLCLAVAVLSARRGGERLVAAALVLTAGADLFLLMLGRWYAAGVCLFVGVQLCYLLRLVRGDGRTLLPLRLALPAALLLAGWGLGALTPLNALALVYYSMLLSNAVHALTSPAPYGRLFGAGLALFACCDLCVGAFNLGPGAVPAAVYAFARVGMWLFYLPSQALITLTAGKLCDDP